MRVQGRWPHNPDHFQFPRTYPLGITRQRTLREWLYDHQDAIVCVVMIVAALVGIYVGRQ